MRCDGCAVERIALKSVRCRDDRDRRGVLCDACYGPLAHRLWIVPGWLNVWGRCRGCGSWESINDLAGSVLGGKHGSWIGTCVDCAGEEGAG